MSSFCTIWSVYKKTLIPYLTHYQCISLHTNKRILSKTVFGHSISEEPSQSSKAFASQLQPFVQEAQKRFFSLGCSF
ncbi:hypothetical protein CW304_23710 [Bacillus sp. UFRGS-B20]|nr:hypothetical protein CW304_23710 [Bacillus sp. UFRGS-B20]